MKPILSIPQMTAAELNSEKNGISRVRLMQNAAEAILNYLKTNYPITDKKITVICGSGNNGGDGAVLAKLLIRAGAKVAVIAPSGLPKTETAKACMEKISIDLSPLLTESYDQALTNADIIIDCVFGTGFHGELPENTARLFKKAETVKAVKISVDIPSGINGGTGIIAPNSFKPHTTLVLAAMKTGLLNLPCNEYCGNIEILDIGIADGCYEEYDALFTEPDINGLFPKRPKTSNKGTFGKLLNVAGSEKYIGAAVLSSKAALRSGAGLVYLASVPKVIDTAAAVIPECVFLETEKDENGYISETAPEKFTPKAEDFSAVTFGCGLGNTSGTRKMAEYLLKNGKSPLIIDADGINAVSSNINVLKDKNRPVIMTPHPGEFARLTKSTVAEVQSNRLETAKTFASKYETVLLLKGANTVIAAPDGRAAVNTTGNTALAKAGCGDVLTGIIGALAAQGLEAFEAAALGAYLHGAAADHLTKSMSPASVLASEVADALGKVI